MSELKLSLIVEAFDHLSAPFKRMEEAIGGPARVARAQLKDLQSSFDKFSNSYAGIASAIGGGLVVRDIIKDNDAFERLRINAGVSRERIDELRGTILDTAERIRVPVDELTQSFNEMRDSGLSLDEAEKNLGTAAETIQRLNGQGAGVGELFAMLDRFSGIKGPDALLKTMAIFRDQMVGINDGFENFMAAAPQLLSSYAALGHRGMESAREISGLYATVLPGTSNPRQARGVVQNILELIGNRESAMRLEQLGVHVYGHTPEERAANARVGTTLPIAEIMQELFQRYTLAPFMFDEMLGPGFKRDFKVPLGEVKQQGFSPTLQAKLKAEGDTTKFLRDSEAASHTFAGSLNALSAALKKIGDAFIAPPLKWFADILGSMPEIAAAAIAALGALSILTLVSKWFALVVGPAANMTGLLVAGVTAFADFFMAIRAGYGVMAAFNLILAANPVGLAIAGIALLAGAALLIYRYWEPVAGFFQTLWEGVVHAFEWAWEKIKPIVIPILKAASFIGDMFGRVGAQLPGVGTGQLGMAAPLGTPAASIFGKPAETGIGAGKRSDVGGEIVIRFDNAPAGMRLDSAKSNNPGVNYDLNMGYSMVAP